MKNDADTFISTAQGRLRVTAEQDAALSDCAALFGQVEQHMLAAKQRDETINKKAWMANFSIPGRFFNGVERILRGKIESQKENLSNYIHKDKNRIKSLNRHLKKNKARVDKWAKKPASEHQRKTLDSLWKKRRGMQKGRQCATFRIKNFEAQKDSGKPSICLGSRRLFRAQYHLEENGYQDHDEWFNDWREARQSQFFLVGSKDDTDGCKLCRIYEQDDGAYTFRVRLPDALVERHGKYLYLTDVTFGHLDEIVGLAVEKNKARKLAESEARKTIAALKKENEQLAKHDLPTHDVPTLNQLTAGFGLALSYRFVKDKKGWRLLVTTDAAETLPEITSDKRKGAIGVDFNADHLAVADIDSKGNKVATWRIPLPRGHQVTSRQNRTAIEDACKQVIDHAMSVGKPVYIEDLNFASKKANLEKGNKRQYNQMISVLSYRHFKEKMVRRGKRFGIEVSTVDPAYTSFLGQLKYLNQTKHDGHQAAAIVIARRGKGHHDTRLPKQSQQAFRKECRVFRVPEDMRNGGRATLYKLKNTLDKWSSDQIVDLRKAHLPKKERVLQQSLMKEMDATLDAL